MEYLKEVIRDINNSNKTLYILCGLPYSGKTYLSERVLAKTSCAYVSIDQILQELGFDWNLNKLPDGDEWEQVFNISYQKSQEALRGGLNVLYDSTNHTKISRDVLRKIAKDVGACAKVIYIDVPIETIWQRREENIIKKDRSKIDKKLVDMTIKSFEIPTDDENLIIVKNI